MPDQFSIIKGGTICADTQCTAHIKISLPALPAGRYISRHHGLKYRRMNMNGLAMSVRNARHLCMTWVMIFRPRSKRILSSGKRWSYYISKDTLTTHAAAAAPGTDPPGCRRYLNFWRYSERLRIRERRCCTGFCRAS